jgi:hypothetical protein
MYTHGIVLHCYMYIKLLILSHPIASNQIMYNCTCTNLKFQGWRIPCYSPEQSSLFTHDYCNLTLILFFIDTDCSSLP